VSFASPLWLLALLVPLAAVLAQRLARARARRYALRLPALATLRQAAATSPQWRRHLPAAALLLAAVALAIALARPHVATSVAVRQASIVLVLDHSGSMAAQDVKPTRLVAARRAADTFLGQLPATVRVGVVAFSSSPDTIVAPTTNRGAVRRTIASQVASGATATGDALSVAISLLRRGATPHARAAIVLLSDGAANAGQNPVTVAAQAAREDIVIETVALGTPDGTLRDPNPLAPPTPVPPDPQLMQAIASTSGGRAFTAQDAGQLDSIYHGLGTRLASRTARRDITAAFIAGGLALLLAAMLASLRWSAPLP